MKFKFYISVVWLLFATSCIDDPTEEQRAQTLVVTGILEGGSTQAEISVFTLNNEIGSTSPVTDAKVTITDEAGNAYSLSYAPDNMYHYEGNDLTIVPGSNYSLEVEHDRKWLNAVASIPPLFSLLYITNNTFAIDENTPNEIAFDFGWQGVAELSYLIELTNDEPTAVATPFFPSETFQLLFGIPFLDFDAQLPAISFNYFGSHTVTVYSIDKELEAVYFYNPYSGTRNLLTEGPDNIDGGKGFFTGINSLSFEIEVQ